MAQLTSAEKAELSEAFGRLADVCQRTGFNGSAHYYAKMADQLSGKRRLPPEMARQRAPGYAVWHEQQAVTRFPQAA